MCGMPSAVSKRAACQEVPGSRPTVSSVPGPVVVERVEAALGEALGDRDERVGALAPGRHRVVLVEAQDVQQLLLELGQRGVLVEVGVHERRPTPASGRAGSSSSARGG